MPEPITHETRAKVARIVARRLARRCAWVDLREAEQEAYLIILAVEQTPEFDPTRGDHWLYVVTRRKLSEWIFAQRSIITPSTTVLRDAKLRNPQGIAQAFNAMRVETWDSSFDPRSFDLIGMLNDRHWSEAVKARILQLLDPEIVAVLFGEQTPRDSARERCTSVDKIYDAMRNARDRLRRDPALRDLWQAA